MQLSLILTKGLRLWSMQVMLSTLMPTANAVGLRSYSLRSYSDRMRAMSSEKSNLYANMLAANDAILDKIVHTQEDEVTSMLEIMEALAQEDAMSMDPTTAPSAGPSASSSAVPSTSLTQPPTSPPNASPTTSPGPCGISPEERSTLIMAVLDTVADPILLRDPTTSQGKAANWLIGEDELLVCPDDDSCALIQRFALAVIYFATNGDGWLQCSANPLATDFCGLENPFIGASRFLSGESECKWAGITCDPQLCVTKVEFGTLPPFSLPTVANEHFD